MHVRLIGPPQIIDDNRATREVRGQKSWAVLARIVLAERPLTRRELSAELFPDADDPLGSLRWCLAGLRKALGCAGALTGDPIDPTLPPEVTIDVLALADGVVDIAATGELLEGIEPRGGPEWATWLLVARQQVAARLAALLREEVITALTRREADHAVRLAELGVRRAPFDEGAHVLLVKSLVLAGHGDAALAHVESIGATFRDELGVEPSPALRSAARAHVADRPLGVPASAVAASLLDGGLAALHAGAVDAGIDCLRRAVAEAEAAADGALLARCLHELGSALVHAVRGFDDEASILLEQAAQHARAAGDVGVTVAALRERAYADALAGRRPEAQRHLAAAAEAAGEDPALRAGVASITAFNLSDWGRHAESVGRFEEALELARRAGDRRRAAWALGLGGWALLSAGRAEEAVRWEEACLTAVRDLAWVSFEPWPTAVLAEVALADDSAEGANLERSFAMSCQLEDPCWEGASGRVLALLHAGRGDHDGALRWITEARRRCARKTDTWAGLLGTILLTEAEIRGSAGDATGAAAAARELVGLAARAHLDDLLPRGVALLGNRRS